ncbi:hypothetical protein VHA01S_005_00320 [Vibrio halioticoli NBRC 102217]|uniref:Outer membrane protein beta-barrel domain-containing protein n=1 Tax=Vibrio halioticoli NBRC 102217 TaxID=1219072 RepID=V5HG33_9VIBR|nr:hypothetical protein [Vibrio halioticoli]GAD88430.1 hypothetical protein VHA01S_005_00320 [Vibrio halioticoli NBRC 102217]
MKTISNIVSVLALLTSTSVLANTDWYVGGGTSHGSNVQGDTAIVELGYNGEIFGGSLYGGKGDSVIEQDTPQYNSDDGYFVGTELEAGWKFHLGQDFTIKPYALIGYELQIIDEQAAKDLLASGTVRYGAGVHSTWKMFYLDVEVAEHRWEADKLEDRFGEYDESVATVTVGFTW